MGIAEEGFAGTVPVARAVHKGEHGALQGAGPAQGAIGCLPGEDVADQAPRAGGLDRPVNDQKGAAARIEEGPPGPAC